jgi:hypothetical protein
MTQALYAHMNNKTVIKIKFKKKECVNTIHKTWEKAFEIIYLEIYKEFLTH